MKTNTANHTPTPWVEVPNFRHVMGVKAPNGSHDLIADFRTGTERTKNIEFVLRAVNAHEALVEVAYTVLPFIEDLIEMGPTRHEYKTGSLKKVRKEILDAIAKVEVEASNGEGMEDEIGDRLGVGR